MRIYHGKRVLMPQWADPRRPIRFFALKHCADRKNLEMAKNDAHLNADHLAGHAQVVTFWSHQHVEIALKNKKATY